MSVRRDSSLVTRWWWTIDRWLLLTLVILMICGILASFSASPAVAMKLGLPSLFFVKRHAIMLLLSAFLMFLISFLNPRNIRYLSLLMYVTGLCLLVVTVFYGPEIKGAKRWISIGSFSLQASEFMKPSLAILSAWALASRKFLLSFALLLFVIVFLLLQPDLGMTVVMVGIWGAQVFVMGLPFIILGALILLGLGGFFCAYLFLPHVTKRIHQFIQGTDPTGDMFQILQSLRAFDSGGVWGKGPGEGTVKHHIPDVHADFVFSVIGEEFGFFVCLFVASLFFFIVVRSLIKASSYSSLFLMLSIAGLSIQFGIQSFVNIASSLHIIPTKGMTLPFLSYGGSSCLALGIGMGMLLALTRKRHGIMEDI